MNHFFCNNSNLLYLILNHKFGLKNKNQHTTNINRLKEIGQKWSKTSICHHKQCIFDQKGPKWPNPELPWTQNYHMIQSNSLEFLTKLREILISSFQENSQKPDFEQNGQVLDQKRSKNDQKFFLSQPKLTLSRLKP